MAPKFQLSPSRELDIDDNSVFYDLYLKYKFTYGDYTESGLGLPTTFADHLSRINSIHSHVVAAEKAWFEELIKRSHHFTPGQYRQNDDSPEHHSSQTTAQSSPPKSDFPSDFINRATSKDLPIPRLRPYRTANLPHFPMTSLGYKFGKYGQGNALAKLRAEEEEERKPKESVETAEDRTSEDLRTWAASVLPRVGDWTKLRSSYLLPCRDLLLRSGIQQNRRLYALRDDKLVPAFPWLSALTRRLYDQVTGTDIPYWYCLCGEGGPKL